jgi:two-component system response regulator NreC
VYSVLLVSSFQLVREALRALIERQKGFQVLGETDGVEHTLRALRNLRPDAVLVDLDPDHAAAVEMLKGIDKHHPDIRVTVLSTQLEDAIVVSALRAGVRGFVSKLGTSRELFETLKTVAQGEACLSPLVAAWLMEWVRDGKPPGSRSNTVDGLTQREIQVLRLLASGRVNKEIAATLNLGVETVRSHRKSLMNKLEIHNVAELTRFAVLAGVVGIAEPEVAGRTGLPSGMAAVMGSPKST